MAETGKISEEAGNSSHGEIDLTSEERKKSPNPPVLSRQDGSRYSLFLLCCIRRLFVESSIFISVPIKFTTLETCNYLPGGKI